MKYSKKTICLTAIPILLILLNLYNPIKQNYVYRKEVVFSDLNLKNTSYDNINDSKFINKAEEILLNLFNDKFDKSNYSSSVNFNNSNYNDTAQVSFFNKYSENHLDFVIGFDLDTGETIFVNNLTAIENLDKDIQSDSHLYDISKKYIHKISNYTDDELIFNFVKDKSYYNLYANIKNTSKYICIILDVNTGSFIHYANIKY